MKRVVTSILFLALSISLFTCTSSTDSNSDTPAPPARVRTLDELTSTELELIDSLNQFAFELFREISHSTPSIQNVFISPLSISYALALCYSGAEGDTKAEIGAALHLPDLTEQQLNEGFHEIVRILESADSMAVFKSANSLWSREGKAIVPVFRRTAENYFKATVDEVDFQDPATVDAINAWVEKATAGKITNMVTPPIDPSVACMLFNAIYFKGGWTLPFDPEKTYETTFFLADGTEKQCQMMHMPEDDHLNATDSTYGLYPQFDPRATWFSYGSYLSTFNLTGVCLPFGDNKFTMTVIDPGFDYTVPSITVEMVIDSLDLVHWHHWVESGQPVKFDLHMPRFKFQSETSLNEALQEFGINDAFDPGQADFSGMFQDGIGWISDAKHKTFIRVDEEGAEAAGITQTVIADSYIGTTVNSPFVIVIHEQTSGAILFMGRISDPVWED